MVGIAGRLSASEIDFVRDVRPILQEHCYDCHGEDDQSSGLRLDIKSQAFKGGDYHGPSLIPGKASDSPLIRLVTSDDDDTRMPPDSDPLSTEEIKILTRWVETGAVWPDGVDLAVLEDRSDHWSFKPCDQPAVPAVNNEKWGRIPIDNFVLARLEQDGLQPATPAQHLTWLRRVTLDLTGLPPTQDEIDEFLEHNDGRTDAYEHAVNRLLDSPRYGERWAQHWLDVVRYADTHGFEVNTERPNAWPYRDYVIQSFNADTPYDRFIKEQIVGDAMGQDSATGFLVTASVLLPGQIGKDAPSIRLARQDSLDEIVNNIGQTFLGLSVGCARCHDHKFDPISAKEYYSMQAFVAGVEYADRAIPEKSLERQQQLQKLRDQVTDIDYQLTSFAPLARPNSGVRKEIKLTDAKQNIEAFHPVNARFVRFTIHDANRHPSLGLIEPCLDEFEIYTDESNPVNIALASAGTKVSASGSRTSGIHQLQHINDGKYGNSHSWMSDTRGRGWVMFELAEPTDISRVVWSRDRLGKFSDRLATAYTLEAGLTSDSLQTLAQVLPSRSPVRSTVNSDRFAPVTTSKLRFHILSTNNLEPCIDELEVFNTAGHNVALASQKATVTTSGDRIEANRHEPRFLHDGEYGNSRSWMSDSAGRGWVEFTFFEAQTIDRVVWGRDRLGEYSDRLATEYRIEVADGDAWQVVADSTDRKPWNSDAESDSAALAIGRSPEDALKVKRLLEEKQKLQASIKKRQDGQKAFAGTFRKPDDIRLLRRGDPELPAERVNPAVIGAIGELQLENSTEEQQRRKALANWIASPENPMTARVMVNRIWQWHFGIGLVETANDFGRNGTAPSHPELLDWLAKEFIRSGWSVKHMHRLIVLSSTYRQSTQHNDKAVQLDADNRLLWRFPARRLEAEAIRDCMLAVSGQLNFKTGGRGFDLFNKRGGLSGFVPVESFSGDGLRRMIYAHKVRRERDAVFGAFDCPDAGQSTPRRIQSTTPIQALNLFNSQLTIEQADAFASRVQAEVGDDLKDQVQCVYEIALGRKPDSSELKDTIPVVRAHGLPTLCRVILNSNEFLFLP